MQLVAMFRFEITEFLFQAKVLNLVKFSFAFFLGSSILSTKIISHFDPKNIYLSKFISVYPYARPYYTHPNKRT